MDRAQITAAGLVIVFTLLSGFGDSQGFLHSAKVWDNGRFVWAEAARSGLGYAFGSVMYWFAVRYLQRFGVVSPEVQTIGWFVVTIIGIALFSGEFLRWQPVDKAVALAVLAGVGWLMVRTGG